MMSKIKKIVLIIIILLSIGLFLPLSVKFQWVQGIAVNERGQLIVMVYNHGGLYHLYIYSNDNKLEDIIYLNGKSSKVSITADNERIYFYYDKLRFIYNFKGKLLCKEENEADQPPAVFEYESGSAKYVYSQNSLGLETVKKYTADGKKKTVYGGKFIYLSKFFWGFLPSLILVPFIYTVIFYPFQIDGHDKSVEDIKELLGSLWRRN